MHIMHWITWYGNFLVKSTNDLSASENLSSVLITPQTVALKPLMNFCNNKSPMNLYIPGWNGSHPQKSSVSTLGFLLSRAQKVQKCTGSTESTESTERTAYFLDTFKLLLVYLFGYFWDTIWIPLGYFWDTFGIILECFWVTVGILLV